MTEMNTENKTTVNTILLTVVTILLTAIGGFVVSIDKKVDEIREDTLIHSIEAEAWKQKIKDNESDIKELRTILANMKAGNGGR
ncbi:MAG: hypothetical protein JSW41_02710 [Candidatus Aenigmatarchaeota archaeon]|nr:MAG: hypothetical protein JSW41_02710 [Candidatus Aenigmarchaeota archaeon]